MPNSFVFVKASVPYPYGEKHMHRLPYRMQDDRAKFLVKRVTGHQRDGLMKPCIPIRCMADEGSLIGANKVRFHMRS